MSMWYACTIMFSCQCAVLINNCYEIWPDKKCPSDCEAKMGPICLGRQKCNVVYYVMSCYLGNIVAANRLNYVAQNNSISNLHLGILFFKWNCVYNQAR